MWVYIQNKQSSIPYFQNMNNDHGICMDEKYHLLTLLTVFTLFTMLSLLTLL